MRALQAALLAEFCHCCGDGCDCGCVLDCRVVNHRRAAGIPDNQKPADPWPDTPDAARAHYEACNPEPEGRES